LANFDYYVNNAYLITCLDETRLDETWPKAQAQEGQTQESPSPNHEGQGQALKEHHLNYFCIVVGGVDIK